MVAAMAMAMFMEAEEQLGATLMPFPLSNFVGILCSLFSLLTVASSLIHIWGRIYICIFRENSSDGVETEAK
jgi:hypothetical protein